MRSSFVKDATCPYCGKLNDKATAEQDANPEVGDVSVCFYCGEIGVYTNILGVMSIRKMREEDIDTMSSETLQSIQRIKHVLRNIGGD